MKQEIEVKFQHGGALWSFWLKETREKEGKKKIHDAELSSRLDFGTGLTFVRGLIKVLLLIQITPLWFVCWLPIIA